MSSSDFTLLSAVTQRASQSERERLQAAALCLARCYSDLCPTIVNDSTDGDAQKPSGQSDAQTSTARSLLTDVDFSSTLTKFCTWAASTPRFIFLLTPSNTIVRSADCGRTWKSIDVMLSGSNSNNSKDDAKEKDKLAVSKTRLLCIACCSHTGAVAVGGTHGFVALSPALSAPFIACSMQQHQGDATPAATASSSSSSAEGKEPAQNRIMFRRIFFNRTGSILFAATNSVVMCSRTDSFSAFGASSSATWKTLIQSSVDFAVQPGAKKDKAAPDVSVPIFTEVALLREGKDVMELAVFASNSQLLFVHISLSSCSVTRRLLIPLKIGSVLKCKEVPLFAQSSTDSDAPISSSSSVNDASSCLVSASGFHRRFKWCNAQFRPGLPPPASSSSSSATASTSVKKSTPKYDHTVASALQPSHVPNVTEFFRSSIGAASSPASSSSSSSSSSATAWTCAAMQTATEFLDGDHDNDAFLSAFRGGLLPPDTVPRVLKCYATDGPVVKSDTTCWLWLWIGEDEDYRVRNASDAAEDDHDDNGSAKEKDLSSAIRAAVYSTATNVSYLPLVQSNPATDTVGLTVTNGGRNIVRASSAGVSTSVDAGRTWSEPQLSCLVAAAPLDTAATIAVSSRAAVALKETGVAEQQQKKKSMINAKATTKTTVSSLPTGTVNNNSASTKWALFPLAADLGVSIITDVAVMS